MADEEDINLLKKRYIHNCTLPKPPEAIDEIIPDTYPIRKKFRRFCLLSPHVCHRRIYAKSTRVLDKERRDHLLNHYRLIHPFSEFSYYWGIFMLIINILQLMIAPVTIINRVKRDTLTFVLVFTLFIGNVNIILNFCTGYYRYDIKEVVLEPKRIALNYLKTFFIPDFLGNFPVRSTMELFHGDEGSRYVLKLLIAFNAFNFIRNLERFRKKRDLDFIIVKLLSCFAITGIALMWFAALTSLAAYHHKRKCNASMWRLLYVNFVLLTGSNISVVYGDYELLTRASVLAFGYVMRYVLIVQLFLFGKTYTVNNLKKTRLGLEVKELCSFKRLPDRIKQKIYKFYEYNFQDVYYNEKDIFTLLSESMRQSLLDCNTKAWFEGDIFKLCPLALRQLISINLDKEVFLKDDIIYTQEEFFNRIYFIKCGAVHLYDEGKLDAIIEEGNFFSENALLLKDGMKHLYKAVAADNCTLFSLKKEKFEKVISSFPDEYNVILDILQKRHEYMLKNKVINKRLKLADYYVSLKEMRKRPSEYIRSPTKDLL